MSPGIRAALDVLLARGAHRRDRPHRGRDGHRQGAGRAQALHTALAPRTGRVVARQLRGAARGSARERALRPREGRLHRRRRRAQRPLREADGGTLFLDEIGEMPLALQAKLLRVLQEGEVRSRVGSDKVAVRSTCASSPRPTAISRAQVAAGRFREDLYYRLNVVRCALPPLRERREDIAAARRSTSSSAAARARASSRRPRWTALQRYRWPGNVRELENLVERLDVFKPEGDLDVSDLPPEIVNAQAPAVARPRPRRPRRAVAAAGRPRPLRRAERARGPAHPRGAGADAGQQEPGGARARSQPHDAGGEAPQDVPQVGRQLNVRRKARYRQLSAVARALDSELGLRGSRSNRRYLDGGVT